MIGSFPWDSLVTEMGEDGFPVYDRSYSADDLAEVYETFFSNGVFIDSDEAMVVKSTSGMMLTVGYGKCHINGRIGYITKEREILTIESTSQPRIATVVLRFDKTLSSRSITVDVVYGTPAEAPTRPALTRTRTVWELGLADILVKANVTSISQTNITDTRLETVRCGAVAPFMTIDTSSFYAKLEAAISVDLKKRMDKLDTEIDRVIFLSDKLTGGTPEGCGCYEELQLVKNLLYDLLNQQNETKYYVIGKTMYPPSDRFTLEGSKISFIKASYEDGLLTLV